MSNINVSYAEMQQAVKDLGNGRQEITERLGGMQIKMKGLVASGFVTDKASVKFEQAFDEYSKSAKTVIQKISEVEGFLTQTAKAMGDLDAQIAAKIQN